MDVPTIIVNKKLHDKKMKEEAGKQIKPANFTTYLSGKKIDDNDDIPVMDKIGPDLALKIQQARLAKKLKQSEVAQLMNMPVSTYQTFESGTGVRNNSTLSILGTKLGVKFTGK
jgi:ribosome-binding protein aMBF1 (putative translation factor)